MTSEVAAVTLRRLEPRRACLEGAKQTLEAVDATLRNAESLELARMTLTGQVAERLALLDLALRQWDQAIAGEEPEGVPVRHPQEESS